MHACRLLGRTSPGSSSAACSVDGEHSPTAPCTIGQLSTTARRPKHLPHGSGEGGVCKGRRTSLLGRQRCFPCLSVLGSLLDVCIPAADRVPGGSHSPCRSHAAPTSSGSTTLSGRRSKLGGEWCGISAVASAAAAQCGLYAANANRRTRTI